MDSTLSIGSPTVSDKIYNNQITFTSLQTHETKKIIVNHVAKYKEIASKSNQKYKKVRRGALADQEIGPGWSILSPEIDLKCTQKQPKTKKIHGAPQTPSC